MVMSLGGRSSLEVIYNLLFYSFCPEEVKCLSLQHIM